MKVNYGGWKEGVGFFNHDIFVDENRRDYSIHFENGSVARQSSAFEEHTADWNCDGDVYTMFGAWFNYYAPDGSSRGGAFHTPEDLVRFAVDALDPDASFSGPRVVKVDGIEIQQNNRGTSLDDKIAQSEARAMHLEAERNRKMKALGIRPSNEPWAK